MAYYLLQNHRPKGLKLAKALQTAMNGIVNCQQCNNLTDVAVCSLCKNPSRDPQILCIVAQPSDVIAIEHSGVYKGLYYVLMGHLSPLDGIGPQELGIPNIVALIKRQQVQEVILALNATVEGEATVYYLFEVINALSLKVSRLAQGIPLGGELEYLDSGTIGRALETRKFI
jgi:recombination protein RecR